MKLKTLMCGALCAAIAMGGLSAMAEDDFGIESASPVTIADPVNPKPGMTANAYNFQYRNNHNFIDNKIYHQMTSTLSALKKLSSAATYVDKGESFSKAGVPNNVDAHTVVWEGYLKCKRAATYTFTFNNKASYSVFVNGSKMVDFCFKQESRDVNMKVGWNHVVIVAYFERKGDQLSINYKPKGSLSEPRALTPATLFHDEKPEEDW